MEKVFLTFAALNEDKTDMTFDEHGGVPRRGVLSGGLVDAQEKRSR